MAARTLENRPSVTPVTRPARTSLPNALGSIIVSALVNAARHGQGRRIGAKSPDRGFPQPVGGRVEDQTAIDVAHQPRGSAKLGLELARSPTRVADDEPRERWRIGPEEPPQQIRRRGQVEAVGD